MLQIKDAYPRTTIKADAEGELDEESTCRKSRQVRREGNRDVARDVLYYNYKNDQQPKLKPALFAEAKAK